MAAASVDALLVTHLPNVFYLCGFTGSNAALIVLPGAAHLFTDGRYTIQALRNLLESASTSFVDPCRGLRRIPRAPRPVARVRALDCMPDTIQPT